MRLLTRDPERPEHFFGRLKHKQLAERASHGAGPNLQRGRPAGSVVRRSRGAVGRCELAPDGNVPGDADHDAPVAVAAALERVDDVDPLLVGLVQQALQLAVRVVDRLLPGKRLAAHAACKVQSDGQRSHEDEQSDGQPGITVGPTETAKAGKGARDKAPRRQRDESSNYWERKTGDDVLEAVPAIVAQS